MQWHEFLEKHPHAVSILISKLANSYYSVSVASSLPRSGSKNAHSTIWSSVTIWSNYGYGTSVQEAFEDAFKNLKLRERTQR